MQSDYDGAWKNLIENRFREVLTLYFPDVASSIDWRIPPKLLSQELKQLGIQEDALGGQRVDFLIEVTTRNGQRKVIFLHLEIQSRKERGFTKRIFRYHLRICAQTQREVVTLVVLADIDPNWRPSRYEHDLLGCRVAFEFPVCKLLDVIERKEGGQERNMGWLAAQAQIAALRTAGDVQVRLRERLALFRAVLQEQGWQKQEIVDAFRLVCWMMKLPKAETLQFRETVANWPEMKTTAPMTDIEEIWFEEGIEKGIEKGIERGLERGRQEGIEKGIEKGREIGIECGGWIGKIHLLEDFLGRPPTDLSILKNETLRQLKTRFQKLNKEHLKQQRKG